MIVCRSGGSGCGGGFGASRCDGAKGKARALPWTPGTLGLVRSPNRAVYVQINSDGGPGAPWLLAGPGQSPGLSLCLLTLRAAVRIGPRSDYAAQRLLK